MKEFLEQGKKTGEKIQQSSIFAGLVTPGFLGDPMAALQIGYAVMMNKPIVLIVDKDVQIPESLVKVAKRIERMDIKTNAGREAAANAIKKMADEFH